MPTSEKARFAAAIHRKLRGIAAVLLDPVATEHERTNAEELKIRLEKQLKPEATPEGTRLDIMFRLGRAVKETKQSTFFEQRLDRSCLPTWQNASQKVQEVVGDRRARPANRSASRLQYPSPIGPATLARSSADAPMKSSNKSQAPRRPGDDARQHARAWRAWTYGALLESKMPAPGTSRR